MNSPRKSLTSAPPAPPIVDDDLELAKLRCLRSLFAETTGNDPFLLQSLKEAIDESLQEEPGLTDSLDDFAQAAFRLMNDRPFEDTSFGFYHLSLGLRSWDPLFVQDELRRGLRKICGYDEALLVVTGLREAVKSRGRYFTQRRRAHYQDAIDFIDRLAARYTTRNMELTVMYL